MFTFFFLSQKTYGKFGNREFTNYFFEQLHSYQKSIMP